MSQKYSQPTVHHIEIKRHHKWIIGSVSSLVIIALVLNSFLIYFLYGQVELSYDELKSSIKQLETDTNSKFSELADSVILTKQQLSSLETNFSSLETNLNHKLKTLKASVGTDFSGIVENSIKSVVTIRTDISQATGFLITNNGYIVTNAHVMNGAKAAGIFTYDGKQHSVSPIGYDTILDVALLKIDGTYEYLSLGNSDNVQIGEEVIAIGNPLGLQFSASKGIVSGVHREGTNGINAYIQTDAALNPGNSGGPLIDKKGKVIGINNFKIGSGESLGFALESNYLKESVNDIAQQVLKETLI